MKKAIVLVSGGMDSCVTASIAKNDGMELYFLHINYGQRTEKRELQSFRDLCQFFSVKGDLIIDMEYFKNIGGSCLTDKNIAVPKKNIQNNDIPISYVPFRNANILSAATSWAEIINAQYIYIGAVEEDSSGYPDCRKDFFNAFEKAISFGTKPETYIKIKTPLINLNKQQIVENGIKLKSPLELTWSCYENEDKPCQECDSCLLRERGFKNAREPDPILT